MALTVIPEKDFGELVSSVNEDNASLKPFSWDEVKQDQNSSTYRDILNYMKTTNVKKIGSGSSRIAFFLPPGSVKDNSSAPSCFKVAKNKKGIAQNDAEISLYDQYGKNKPCFPELYEADTVHKYYIQTEVGKAVNKKKFQLKEYFMDWNKYVIDMKMGNASYPPYYYLGSASELEPFLRNYEYMYHIYKMAEALNVKGRVAGWGDDPEYVLDDLDDIAREFPKYNTVVETLRFSVEGGWEKGMFDDFAMNDSNWAFVIRNGEQCLLPIDWGFTNEVQEKYY